MVAVRGTDAAPDVTLTGPGGLRLAIGAGHKGMRTAAGLVIPDDAHHTTFLVLSRAPAGRYTVSSSADGSRA